MNPPSRFPTHVRDVEMVCPFPVLQMSYCSAKIKGFFVVNSVLRKPDLYRYFHCRAQ
jgi:hypothetical protein